MMSEDDLAAVIRRTRADEAIAALRDDGIYDDRRRITPVGTDHLAIPVMEEVPLAVVERYERGVATERRRRTLEDHLRASGWSDDELDFVPSSYARIGDLVVVTDALEHRPDEVAGAILDLHGDCAGVIRIEAIEGGSRQPVIDHIAGVRRSHTIHREHGIEYELDLADVMFSPGNLHERARMGEIVESDERVVDLCAGIGYFTLPMADAGAVVTAIERNPGSFRWLSRNITRNHLDDRVTAVCGDCRECTVNADRAVIGHLPVHDCRDDPSAFGDGYLDAALRAVDTGWIHVHGLAWAGEMAAAVDALGDRLEARGTSVRSIEGHRVKGIAPATDHIVVDALVEATSV